jgi:hypothetical protein
MRRYMKGVYGLAYIAGILGLWYGMFVAVGG